MALSVSLRAFKSVPADMRQWSNWIRECVASALTGTLDTAFIADNAVTLPKLAQVATDTVLGRSTAGTGNVEAIACTSAGRAILDDASAAAQRTTLGLGTSAIVNTGTSGATIPLLSTANTWTLAQTHSTPPIVPTYTVAGVPSAAVVGQLAYISNEAGGAVLAFTDGTNWRRVTDRAVIS